jgi:sugar phosphate isomerase/epimerase
VFSHTPLKIWLQELGKYLGQLHLHDNHGSTDEHLPVGNGKFPFAELFQALKENKIHPIITLEAHAQDDLWQSLENIKSMALLDFICETPIPKVKPGECGVKRIGIGKL